MVNVNDNQETETETETEFDSTVVESTCNQFEPSSTPRSYEEWRAAKIKNRAKYV